MQSTDIEYFAHPDPPNASWSMDAEPVNELQASLPTIMLHTALTIIALGGVFYWAHIYLAGALPATITITGLAMMVLCGPLGLVAARVTDTPPLTINLGWGCGLTVLVGVFFGICGLGGALLALLFEVAGLSA